MTGSTTATPASHRDDSPEAQAASIARDERALEVGYDYQPRHSADFPREVAR